MRTLAFIPLLAATVCCAQAPEVFRNPVAGIEITKPAGWVFAAAGQDAEGPKRSELNADQFRAAVARYSMIPLVAMSKYPEPHPDLNPGFKVNMRPLNELNGRPPIEVIRTVLPQLLQAFPDAKVVQPPVDVTVSDHKGAYARVDHTFRSGNNQFSAASELWIIPRGDFFFIFSAATRQDEKSGSRKEIAAIVKSVRLSRK